MANCEVSYDGRYMLHTTTHPRATHPYLATCNLCGQGSGHTSLTSRMDWIVNHDDHCPPSKRG